MLGNKAHVEQFVLKLNKQNDMYMYNAYSYVHVTIYLSLYIVCLQMYCIVRVYVCCYSNGLVSYSKHIMQYTMYFQEITVNGCSLSTYMFL